MRVNLPVTQRAYPFPAGQTLVSTTDLQGRILYCNPAFIEVSGYAREELLGQPHNLIRHPDMPEEAFRDMWATIASGQPWSAMVKNRRKDGDHYWVMANVTPLMEGDKPCGYMSVRTEPSAAQIDAAERLYADMRAEKQAGRLVHRLSGGSLQRVGVAGRLQRLLHPGLGARIALIVGAAVGAGALAAWLAQGWPAAWAAPAVLAIAGVAVWAAAHWVHRIAVRPALGLTACANRMAAGDFTQGVPHVHEGLFGALELALNQLSVNMKAVIRDTRNEVAGLRSVARELAAGNQDLSARTESQASSLEETAASMEQITGTVRASANSASGAADFAQRVTEITQRSAAAVNHVNETMQAIDDSSRRIRDIIQVIDGIAFQTNILALNAAVEAARAGEQGRGFAVVAGEVRALSQRTAAAAREVKTLIEDSTHKVASGAEQTAGARQTMDEVLEAVQRVGALVGEIRGGSNEQLLGISQINEAVTQMDGITQHNAALVEELAAAATSVSAQAEAVAECVSVFRIGDSPAGDRGTDAVALRKQMKAKASPAR